LFLYDQQFRTGNAHLNVIFDDMNITKFYFALGRPLAPVYSAAMRIRENWYRRGTLKSYRLEAPVISVGNLTMGGTGKTPMVQYLARLLQSSGFRPAVVSRGYGGKARDKVNLVSDGSRLLLDAANAGDEPRFLAETLPGVPVLTGIVRRLPAQKALDMGSDVLLLDDGFQHLQIVRDINLVLFNTDRLAGNSRVFPGGELREPVAALKRATRFILTGVHEENRLRAEQFGALLQKKFPEIPVTLTGYGVDRPVRLANQGVIEAVDADLLTGTRGFGFCGIAHPQSLRDTLERHGYNLAGFSSLEDHQQYSSAMLEKLLARARRAGAEFLLTTEKDLVKLAGYAVDLPLPLFALRMEVVADDHFNRNILADLHAWKQHR
jgi:tetraacyldisaccharide 4'-kinase